MYPILSLVLLLVSLGLVGYPFWQARFADFEDEWWLSSGVVIAHGTNGEIHREKDKIMNTLSEIEFDYHMQKLSFEDYKQLKDDYTHVAIAALEAEGFLANLNIVPVKKERGQSLKMFDSVQIEREIEEDLGALRAREDNGFESLD